MIGIAIGILGTIVLLFWTGLFLLGTLPLVFLQHRTPNDARFIRSFFNVYFIALVVGASIAALGYAWAARWEFAAGMAIGALLAILARQVMVPRMDALRPVMREGDPAAIHRFRRLHVGGMLLNVVALGAVTWGTSNFLV
jgi:membrane-bound metal-dependent hydrolase YbcI (DUF457 family)